MTTGLFLTLLFGWIASVYLLGESGKAAYQLFERTSFALFIMLIISGLFVFLAAEYYHLLLFKKFTQSYISLGCILLATIVIPILWMNIKRKNVLWMRLLAGLQTACILAGWFAVQFPVMVYRANGNSLTIWNSQAPEKTMYYLIAALIVGVLIILPSFAYLFKIFKFSNDNNLNT